VLTIREVAAELRCSKAHVHNIISGKVHDLPPLPVLRIGRRVLVRHDALARWMARIEGRELELMRGSGDFLPDDLESIAGA
jgi:excisionase family DNA binding protein